MNFFSSTLVVLVSLLAIAPVAVESDVQQVLFCYNIQGDILVFLNHDSSDPIIPEEPKLGASASTEIVYSGFSGLVSEEGDLFDNGGCFGQLVDLTGCNAPCSDKWVRLKYQVPCDEIFQFSLDSDPWDKNADTLADGCPTGDSPAYPFDFFSRFKCSSKSPSETPSETPSASNAPSETPSEYPSESPSERPSDSPSKTPSDNPSEGPSERPSDSPSKTPSDNPSEGPSERPSDSPSKTPSDNPSEGPSVSPSNVPSYAPSRSSKKGMKQWRAQRIANDPNFPTFAPKHGKVGHKHHKSNKKAKAKKKAKSP